jgi:Amt family ammonium transporter
MFAIWAVTGKPDLGMALNGILAGLVGITANCAAVTPTEAVIIGLIAGVIVVAGTLLLDKIRIDDPVGAFPVHGMCGVWGCLAYGLFGDLPDEMTRGGFIGVQLVGIVAIAVWAFITSFVLFSVIKVSVGLRASETDELEGLDLTEHGAEAYPDYSLRIH